MGYGSCGRAPPNSPEACFEAFDNGADAFAVEVCETDDGVLVVGNRRTLRMLTPRDDETPRWDTIRRADLGGAFGLPQTRSRVTTLQEFLGQMGPLSIHLVLDGPLRRRASAEVVDVVCGRMLGETTVIAVPEWLGGRRLPAHVPRVALFRGGEGADDIAGVRADAVAAAARSLPSLGRLSLPKVALRCDTRSALVAARVANAAVVHTERPAWFRCAWDEASWLQH